MDAKGIEAKETVSASKKLSRGDAAALVKSVNNVIVAKGKKVQSFPGGKASKEFLTHCWAQQEISERRHCELEKRCWWLLTRALTPTF
jgi:hypothetical protein